MPYRVLVASVPVGTMLDYGGSAAPSGWLLCNGSVKKKADYAALFAVLGSTFNVGGEAGDEFRLPMCCGRTRIGKGTCDDGVGTTFVLGEKKGVEKESLIEGDLPAHTHSQDVQASVVTSVSCSSAQVQNGEGASQDVSYGVGGNSSNQGSVTGSVGSNNMVSKMQPSLVVTAIIKF